MKAGGPPPPNGNGTAGPMRPGGNPHVPDVAYLVPQALALVVLIFAIFFSVTALVIVTLRIWVRSRGKMLGVDDSLMLVGLLLFFVDAGLASYATFQGLGTPTALVSDKMAMRGLKYVMIWQLFYVSSLSFIKVSICLTLLRIAVERRHQWALYITMGISISVALVGFIGDLSLCQPVSAQWNANGSCAPRSVSVSLNYTISAGAIVTDWACAIIPAWILWNARMKKKVKLSVGIVLGLGSVASLSTFARLPYIRYYDGDADFLYKVGFIVLWSVFEGGIGLIAGSLPMLRRFFKRWLGSETRSTNAFGAYNISKAGIPTIKPSVTSSLHRVYYPRRGSRARDERDWELLEDGSAGACPLQGVPEHPGSQHEFYEMNRQVTTVTVDSNKTREVRGGATK